MLETSTFTAVDFPGTTFDCGTVGDVPGDGLFVGTVDGLVLVVAVGDGVLVGATPPPPLAGVVDAGVTPAIVTDVDSIERAPAPIAFVASTCAEYWPADKPENTCDVAVASLNSLV